MANPSYPNMPGQMPPGMGPPGMPPGMGGMPPGMGGPPMGAMPMPRPIRRGTSKAVPVVVSAGLAVGVFCGLLFGVGTGTEASATPTASNAKNLKGDTEAKPEPGSAPQGLGATKTVDTPKPAATGSAAPVAAGSGAAPATPPKPVVEEKKQIHVKLVIKPDDAKDMKIKIDGNAIEGLVADLPLETKSFKVEVKATGYHTYENTFTTMPDAAGSEMKIEFELRKRAPAGTGVRPPKRPERPTTSGGGGLIDI